MPKYKNTKTGKVVELSESYYDQIKHQLIYFPVKKSKDKAKKKAE